MTQTARGSMVRRMGARRVASSTVILLASSLGVAACNSGTETGNPSITGALSYTGYSSSSDYGVRQGGDVATVTSAVFDLAAVEIDSVGACGLDTTNSFSVAALGVGDHAAGRHNVTAFEAKPGMFCSVALPFARVLAGAPGVPRELEGHSIWLQGNLADGTTFSVISDATPLIELESDATGFALSDGNAKTLMVFDFAAWLNGLDFAAATRTGGVISISKDENSDLLQRFDDNLASGVALYRDRDGDGVLDENPELLARAR